MKKIISLMALAAVALSFAANRVGPVSQYGQLQAGKINNVGRILGSCPTYNNTPVVVRGMSLYWINHSKSSEFWSKTSVAKMVTDMKIEVIRAAVGTSEDCWSGDNCPAGYISDKEKVKTYVDNVVQAAIENDIYVIIDWHSHTANNQLSEAKDFFGYMAETYGSYDNVIFEIFNEPINQDWNTIKSYADTVISVIRGKNSDNLILVGSRQYDQYPNEAASSPINDDNVAYTFHYYALTHSTASEGANAVSAMNAGLSVFVSEWGTGDSYGNGDVSTENARNLNNSWQSWLNDNYLSAANWSASKIDEGTAAFASGSTYDNFSYTVSGNMVKGFLANNPSTYTACSSLPSSSASVGSSASVSTDPVIDDFEDENTTAEALGEDAFWYLYEAGATITNAKPTAEDEPWGMVFADGDNHYAAMTGISGIQYGSDANEVYTSAGIGLNVPAGALANCTAIQYSYKGSAHFMRGAITGVTPDKGYEHTSAQQASSTTWKTVKISTMSQPSWVKTNSPSDVKTFSWGAVEKLTWYVDEKTQDLGTELAIDNVTCVGTLSPASTTTSSSSTASSSGSTTTAGTSVFDDFDDGNATAENVAEDAYWYIYTAGGTVTNTQDATQTWDMISADGTNSYASMKGISGITSGDTTYPSVGVGVDFGMGALANCTAISYKYKGSGHHLRGLVDGVTKDKGYEHVAKNQDASSGWTTVTVTTMAQPDWVAGASPSDVKAFSWATVKGLAWVVDEKLTQANIGTQLDIDDVECVGGTIQPTASSASSGTNSGSSTVVSGDAETFDDFDDGNTVAENIADDAYWYLYKAGGTLTNTQDANQTWDMIVSEGTNSYAAMKGIGGITSGATTYPSVGMGVDFGVGVLAQCTAIQYDYKGSGHHLRGLVDGVTKDKGYEHVAPNQNASSGWTTVTVSVMTQPDWVAGASPSDVKPFSWAGVKGLAWVVDEKLTQANIGTELDIDNVKCVGKLSAGSSSNGSGNGSSTNGNGTNGNGTNGNGTNGNGSSTNGNGSSTNGNGTDPSGNGYANTAIGVVAAPAGLSATIHGNTLQVTVAKAGLVKVQVFDMMGHTIESHSESMAAGSFAHTFGSMGKGAYIVRVQQGSMAKTIRMQVR